MALFADFYEFTMAQADVNDGNHAICTANYFVRSIPQGGLSHPRRVGAGRPLHLKPSFLRCRPGVAPEGVRWRGI